MFILFQRSISPATSQNLCSNMAVCTRNWASQADVPSMEADVFASVFTDDSSKIRDLHSQSDQTDKGRKDCSRFSHVWHSNLCPVAYKHYRYLLYHCFPHHCSICQLYIVQTKEQRWHTESKSSIQMIEQTEKRTKKNWSKVCMHLFARNRA